VRRLYHGKACVVVWIVVVVMLAFACLLDRVARWL
jgi:hypothetical protein